MQFHFLSDIYSHTDKDVVSRIKNIMDKVFEEYANKDSWSLSRLTHGEIAWKNSRKGVSDGANSDFPIDVEDIRKDAERVRNRRERLIKLGLV